MGSEMCIRDSVKAANAKFRNVPIVKRLSKEFKVPAYMLNDCTAAALGEKVFGAAKNFSNFVYVGIGDRNRRWSICGWKTIAWKRW